MGGMGLFPLLLPLRSDGWSKPLWRIAVGVNRPGSGEGDGDIASPSSVRPASPRLARGAMGCVSYKLPFGPPNQNTRKHSHAHIESKQKH